MKILYLCSKKQFETKMSRVRFDGMEAISKISDLTYSGGGWENYDMERTVQENIDSIYGAKGPDIVVAYKPLALKGFKDIEPVKCLRYNEMWDRRGTEKEIVGSGAQLVICHHLNDIPKYKHLENVKLVNISHCAEKKIYKDFGLEKTTDVLLVGAVYRPYPFRMRLRKIMIHYLNDKVRCKILSHPGGDLRSLHGQIREDYAKEINRAKITLTCSSKYKYRLGKYTEIPMCGSLLGADLPNEDHDFFKKFMLVLDPDWTDEQIAGKIIKYVKNDKKRNRLIQKGLRLNAEYTQEKYAERFIVEAEKFLNGN